MSKHCINHLRITYDCCRSCSGKDNDCPEYLDGKFEYRIYHSRQTEELDNHQYSVLLQSSAKLGLSADTYIPNSLEEWLKRKIKRIGGD
jgi:hypothetical protein